ncbi:hypothetical protein K443DRAFT_333588 [Laccaria amethystina LaAM-08-1]|uniref:Uncharacterized protein n=1 Tax=Laccaria amethystina LaAM-08-1 TaxID=1095629 RepID=A0A0C9WTD9_9AGAR|nr:hypothetical protein K443DRAFT_333588 [Laccaria amethystina LaAM-08-1]
MIAPPFPVTKTRTTRPLAPLRASAREGGMTSTKLMDRASSLPQWPQAHTSIL